MNPNVTEIEAHSHRFPVAKEANAAEVIRKLEKQCEYAEKSRSHGSLTSVPTERNLIRKPTGMH